MTDINLKNMPATAAKTHPQALKGRHHVMHGCNPCNNTQRANHGCNPCNNPQQANHGCNPCNNQSRTPRLTKTLLLALLLALLATGAANAQNRTIVTIGEGTDTQNLPLPGLYGYQYNVYLYTPSAAPALNFDCDISSIAFNVSANNTNTGARMYIWVKDVDADYALANATTFSQYTAGATQVYENDDFSSTLGWNTFAFTSDFSHEGGKALLVAIYGVGCTGSGGCYRRCYCTEAEGTQWYRLSDYTDPGMNASGGVYDQRADIQLNLTYTECPYPSGLAVSNITGNSATLSWTEIGEATAWQICVNDDEENLIDADTNPYTLTGLTLGTEYTVKVRANCGSEQSAWSTGLTFTTPCAVLPYSYGFEDAGDLDCWEVIATSILTGITTAGDAPEGSKVFRFYRTEQNAYLASPVFSGTEQGLDVAFQYMNSDIWSTYTEQFQVGYTTDADAAPADFTYGETIYGENHWVTYENTFPANTKRIAIKYIFTNGDNLRLDDFNFGSASCPRPTNLTAGTPEPHSVELSWTETGEATAWQICVNDDEENLVDAGTNPYTLTGLTPVTEYTVKVRANCGSEQSAWSNGLTFTTRCGAFVDLPYSYGFEDAGNLYCWEVIATSPNTGIATVADAPEGEKVFRFYRTEQNAYLASPVFSGTEQGLDVTFQYMNNSTWTNYTDQFQVGYTTDAGAAPADFTYGETIYGENHWVTYENTFPANTKRIAIRYIFTNGDNLRLDDFNFGSASCPRPRDLTAGTPGPHSVELGWTERGEATAWQICVNDDEENLMDADTNPYTLTGLTPVTEYTVKVRANCGSEQSDWSNALTFTTPCEAFALPYSYGFEDAGDMDCWEVIATRPYTGITTANDAPEGSKVFRFVYSEQNAYLASPVFSGTGQGLDVTFQYMNYSSTTSYIEQFQVGYTTDAGAAPADFTYGETIYGENHWVTYENTFPANTKRIAIKYIYTNGWYLRLDDFNFGSVSCPIPTNLTAEGITATTADLSWNGSPDTENFTVRYRTPAGMDELFTEDFEDETSFANWTFISMNTANAIGTSNGAGRLEAAAHSGSYGFRFSSYSRKSDGETYDQYLVSPELTVTGELSFYFKKTNPYTETLYFGYSTTTNDLEAFTWTEDLAPTQSWQQYTQDLPTDVKYVAFHYFGNFEYYVYVDDIVIGNPIPAGEWETVSTTEMNVTLTGLTPNTLYEAQVKTNCGEDSESEWSEIAYFTTLEQTTVTQTVALSAGWNWWSTYLEITNPIEMLQMLETALGENGIQIKNSDISTEYDSEWGWFGDLDEVGFTNEEMIMIKTANACTFELQGPPAHPASHPITINPGWNWIGYPCAEEMTLNQAFSNFTPEVGDQIKNSEGSSEYDSEWGWFGDVENLVPGQGFMYYSSSAVAKTLVFQTGGNEDDK